MIWFPEFLAQINQRASGRICLTAGSAISLVVSALFSSIVLIAVSGTLCKLSLLQNKADSWSQALIIIWQLQVAFNFIVCVYVCGLLIVQCVTN